MRILPRALLCGGLPDTKSMAVYGAPLHMSSHNRREDWVARSAAGAVAVVCAPRCQGVRGRLRAREGLPDDVDDVDLAR